MRFRYWFCVPAFLVLVVAISSTTFAQQKEPDKLGPEHQRLQGLVGVYDAKMRVYGDPAKPPIESAGTMQRSSMFGGRYLKEEYSGKIAEQQFQGFGLVGYDFILRKYMSIWLDSVSTDMMISQGTYSDATKTFTYDSDQVDADTGQRIKARDVLRILSKDEQLFEMWRAPAQGKEFKVLEIRYTRKR